MRSCPAVVACRWASTRLLDERAKCCDYVARPARRLVPAPCRGQGGQRHQEDCKQLEPALGPAGPTGRLAVRGLRYLVRGVHMGVPHGASVSPPRQKSASSPRARVP